ncbi:hypothetical protein F4678DRAFT_325466 [Xylaria arbuscula]|nr:hypothetical protein F4678DRAFT_325466 [Xylaria arbuscula]
MEAIAAAGALPGLASATIQLGTATFQFYQQLHSLYKAIKNGENDLKTALKRLEQHGDFIKELRFNFERTSDASISPSSRSLFEGCIKDSEAEVKEFKCLLDRVGKHHFKKKAWQAVETGSRLRIHEQDIKQYCELLDRQMQRFLFLQSSLQSMRVELTLSEVLDTLVEQGAKAVEYYDQQSSLHNFNRDIPSPFAAGSRKTQLPSKGIGKHSYTTSSSLQDVIPKNWNLRDTKSYLTLCGTVTVMTFSDSRVLESKDHSFAYKVWFEPYSWISRTVVEWRCLVSSTQTVPMFVLSSITSIICDDPDVLDVLGLVEPSPHCPLWPSKLPDSRKVRALLDTRRLLKDHVLCRPGCEPEDIITTFLVSHQFEHILNHIRLKDCDSDIDHSEPDSSYLSRYYIEYYSIIEQLLSYGFQPHISSWQYIYDLAVRNYHYILEKYPKLLNALNLNYKSIPFLILSACSHSIPISYMASFENQLWMSLPSFTHTGEIGQTKLMYSGSHPSSVSYLAHLITQEDSAERIREVLNLDPLDFTDKQYMFDRWILGLFASFRPEIASIVEEYSKSCKTITARIAFDASYIREEFKQPPCKSNRAQRQDLLRFICFHGNAAIIQQLDLAALTQEDLRRMHYYAAQSSNQELFGVLMSLNCLPAGVYDLFHTKFIRHKLNSDPIFFESFIRFIEDCHKEPLLVVLRDDSTLGSLLLPTSHPLPIRKLIEGQIRRYETQPLATEWDIPSIIYNFMCVLWNQSLIPSKHLLLPDLHFYDILRRLAQSPAFEISLNTSNFKFPYHLRITDKLLVDPYPSVQGYSALMLALQCGMKPAVQILVDAGASISKPMCCGKSALSLARENARARHPRQWAVFRDRISGVIISTSIITKRPDGYDDGRRISENIDKEMLEILLKALRDRGEVERKVPGDLPMPGRWEVFREKAGHLFRWLFKPSYTFNPEAFRENGIYAILVSVLWFLSVLKVLKVELGDCPSHVAKFLSRPVVMFALVAWILLRFW